MPRLTNTDFIKIHHQLRQLWLQDQAQLAELTAAEQWSLHAFFQPSKNLTNQQLTAYRGEITWHQPSLPHKAGRALAKLRRGSVSTVREQGITIRAVVRPEPDLHKLARALSDLAKRQEPQNSEEPESPAA